MSKDTPEEPLAQGGSGAADTPPPSSAIDPDPTQLIPRVSGETPYRRPLVPEAGETQSIPRVTDGDQPGAEWGASEPGREPDKPAFGGSTAVPSILLTPPTVAGRHERRPSRRGRFVKRFLATVATILVFALAGGWFYVRHLNGNIHTIQGWVDPRPVDSATLDPGTGLPPTNILLMGSDTRAGADSKYGDPNQVTGARSDVQLIAHLSADRKFATIVSIPRDTMVKGPKECKTSEPVSAWETQQFNRFFEMGGVNCTRRVVEQMTGLNIDGSAIIDFTGFKEMVNAIGTVPVCLTKPVKDKDSGANFPAGRQRLNGEQALAFVRVRHNVGDGSDLGRIKRQQDFLSAMIREVTSKGVLLNPTKIVPFVDALTKSLQASPGMNTVPELVDMASSVRAMETKNIAFVSMPWQTYKPRPAQVEASPAATKVWKMLQDDKPWPGTPAAVAEAAASGSASASASPSTSSASPSPTASPSGVLPKNVTVDVVNATGLEGYAKQSADALTAQGFVVSSLTSNPTTIDGVVIHHSAADKAKAQELAAAFDGATLKADGIAGQALRLEIGLGASKVKLVPNAPAGTKLPAQAKVAPPTKTTVEAKTADEVNCTDTSAG